MTRIAIAAPSRPALDALTDLLGGDPHLTVVARFTRLDALFAPHLDAMIDAALVSTGDVPRLRAVLAAVDEHRTLPPIVVLGDRASTDESRALVRLGVRALLPGHAGAREILAALEAVNAGLVVVAAESFDALLQAQSRQPVRLPAHPELERLAPLSPREREILGLVAEGLGNKIVASRLGISEHTVKTHISSIFVKLGADTRAEAVAKGARQGMILL